MTCAKFFKLCFVGFCEKGHASVNGFEPCHPCPEDTYQYQEGSDFCLECPAGTTTNGKASISFQNCTGKSLTLQFIFFNLKNNFGF